jgi:predicted Rossmann-fold nucleotide-binding protein
MADLSDAFIALPGGFGTLEEFCEMVTWAQGTARETMRHRERAGILFATPRHVRPCGRRTRFLKVENRGLVLARNSAAELLQALEEWRPVRVEKWLDRETR